MYRFPYLVRYLLIIALSGIVVTDTASAQATPPAPDMPGAIASFFNDLTLGVRLEGGVFRWGHSAPPLVNEDLRFLKRPVSGNLSFTTPLYGVSGALRYHGTEIRVSYRGNFGVRPSPYLKWKDGTFTNSHRQWERGAAAIPLTPRVEGLEVEARYMLINWVGVGIRYNDYFITLSQDTREQVGREGPRVSTELFDGTVWREFVSIVVPLRYAWNKVTVFGTVGTTVYGSSQQRYRLRFLLHEEDPTMPSLQDDLNTDRDRSRQTSLTRQFARIGVAYPVLGTTLRLSGSVERVDVPGVTADWHAGGRLAVGIPF